MTKDFSQVLGELALTEAKEPPQSTFDAFDSIKRIEKEIDLLKKWTKYYKSPAGKDYNDDAAELTQKAIKELEVCLKALDKYDMFLGS